MSLMSPPLRLLRPLAPYLKPDASDVIVINWSAFKSTQTQHTPARLLTHKQSEVALRRPDMDLSNKPEESKKTADKKVMS